MSRITCLATSLALSILSIPTLHADNPVADEGGVSLSSDDIVKVSADVRVDYQHQWNDGETVNENSGIEGKYFIFKVEGTIVDGLTYSWRQRLNKPHKDASFFDATDWVYVNYAYHNFIFNAGKEVVEIGGYEYDRYPIDLYSTSLFWQNISCFQFGASVGYDITPRHRLIAQVAQSMFHSSDNRNMWGYNLLWAGNMGCYSTRWSVNLTEYAPKHYISYITLGNRLELDRVTLELDLMNRASSHQTYFLRDVSIIGELAWQPTDRWRIHGKVTYDVNRSGTDADMVVLDGTELTMIGGGVEFMPLLKKRTSLRLHASCYHSWGHNSNSADVMQNQSTVMSVGVRWFMDLFTLNRK